MFRFAGAAAPGRVLEISPIFSLFSLTFRHLSLYRSLSTPEMRPERRAGVLSVRSQPSSPPCPQPAAGRCRGRCKRPVAIRRNARISAKRPFRRIFCNTRARSTQVRKTGQFFVFPTCFPETDSGWSCNSTRKKSLHCNFCGTAGMALRAAAVPESQAARGFARSAAGRSRAVPTIFCKIWNGLSRSGKRDNILFFHHIRRNGILNDHTRIKDGFPEYWSVAGPVEMTTMSMAGSCSLQAAPDRKAAM